VHKLDKLYAEWWDSPRSNPPKDVLIAGVRSVAEGMTHDEDVAQAVAIVVLTKIDTFVRSDSTAFSRWVRSIISRTRKGAIRDGLRRREDQYMDETEYGSDTQPFRDLNVLSDGMREIARSLLIGYSIAETAESLGVKPDSITKKVRRACPKSSPFAPLVGVGSN